MKKIESLPSIDGIDSLMVFFKDRRDRFDHGQSFSTIEESESIPSIFKKDQRAKIEVSNSIFWHKRGGGNSFKKIYDEYVFFKRIARFLTAIQSRSIFLKDRQERFDYG